MRQPVVRRGCGISSWASVGPARPRGVWALGFGLPFVHMSRLGCMSVGVTVGVRSVCGVTPERRPLRWRV